MKPKVLQLAVAFILLTVAVAQTQYGCQLSQNKCSGNGVCELSGYCTCSTNFAGESCEIPVKKTLKKGSLGKGFITFWVLFWILLNFLLPFVICAIIKYAKDKDCSDIKSILGDVCEAVCCCFTGNKQSRRPFEAASAPKGLSLVEEDMVKEVKEEPANQELKLAEPSKNSPSQIELEKLHSSQPPENSGSGVVKLPSIHPKPSKVVYSHRKESSHIELPQEKPQVFELFNSDLLQNAEFEGVMKYKFKTHNSLDRDMKDMLKSLGVDDLLGNKNKNVEETLATLEQKLKLGQDKKLKDSNLFDKINIA